MLIKISKK